MTTAGMKSALAALGMTERGLARAIGSDERSVRRWTAGDRAIPASLSLLLTLALEIDAVAARLAVLAAPQREKAPPA